METSQTTWSSGIGTPHNWSDVLDDIRASIESGARIFVGADSIKEQKDCTFVVTVCIYNLGAGGRYYFNRFKQPSKTFPSLRARIFQEAAEAIEATLAILTEIPDAPVEIHLDVNKDKKHATGTFSDQVVGYAKSIGVDCKIKPDSWASSGIADKHTRHRFNKRQTENR